MKVLVIEDSRMIAGIIDNCMKNYGYEMKLKTSKNLTPYSIDFKRFDFAVINLSLENIDPRKFIEKIKSINPKIYLIGINNKGTWQDKVGFLNNGGDDVLDYPFPMQELFARIQAILRRPINSLNPKIAIANLEIDPAKRIVKKNDKSILLNKMEFNLLEYMARNKNRPISRTELSDHVWDYKRSTNSNTVDVHMSKLRRNLEGGKLIETVHGVGYMLRDSANAPSNAPRNLSSKTQSNLSSNTSGEDEIKPLRYTKFEKINKPLTDL